VWSQRTCFWVTLDDHDTNAGSYSSDFRYTSDVVGHIRLYEAGNTYDMPRALAHAAAKRDLVAVHPPVDWEPPNILRPPVVLTEAELAAAEAELKALQRHAFEIVHPEPR
jgi:hypothetical protein